MLRLTLGHRGEKKACSKRNVYIILVYGCILVCLKIPASAISRTISFSPVNIPLCDLITIKLNTRSCAAWGHEGNCARNEFVIWNEITKLHCVLVARDRNERSRSNVVLRIVEPLVLVADISRSLFFCISQILGADILLRITRRLREKSYKATVFVPPAFKDIFEKKSPRSFRRQSRNSGEKWGKTKRRLSQSEKCQPAKNALRPL